MGKSKPTIYHQGPLCIATYQKLKVTAMEVIMRGLLNPADIRAVEEGALAKAEREALIFQTNVEFLVAISRRGVYQAANAKKHPGLKVLRENFEEFQV